MRAYLCLSLCLVFLALSTPVIGEACEGYDGDDEDYCPVPLECIIQNPYGTYGRTCTYQWTGDPTIVIGPETNPQTFGAIAKDDDCTEKDPGRDPGVSITSTVPEGLNPWSVSVNLGGTYGGATLTYNPPSIPTTVTVTATAGECSIAYRKAYYAEVEETVTWELQLWQDICYTHDVYCYHSCGYSYGDPIHSDPIDCGTHNFTRHGTNYVISTVPVQGTGCACPCDPAD